MDGHDKTARDHLGFDTEALLAEASWVQKLAHRLTQDYGTGNDVAQDALAVALEKRPNSGEGLRPWLHRVVSRLAQHETRGKVRRANHESRAVSKGRQITPSVDELLLKVEAQRLLADAVCRLPDPYRDVLLRRYYDGHSIEEIAQARKQQASTIRSQLTRATKRLREQFEAGGDTITLGKQRSFSALGLFSFAAGTRGAATAKVAGKGLGTWFLSKTSMTTFATISTLGVAAALVAVVSVVSFYRDDQKDVLQVASTETPAAKGGDARRHAGSSKFAGSFTAIGREDGVTPTVGAGDAAHTSQTKGAFGTIRSRMIDRNNNPIPGAELSYRPPKFSPFSPQLTAVADANGVAVLVLNDALLATLEVRNRYLPIAAGREGFADYQMETEVDQSAVTDLGNITLRPGGTLTGTAVFEDGRPAAGARIISAIERECREPELRKLSGPYKNQRRVETVADEAGRFACSGLKIGDAQFWVQAEDSLWTLTKPNLVSARATSVGTVVLPAADPSELITGVVLSGLAPVPGVVVSVESFAESFRSFVITRQDGTFVVMPGTKGPVVMIARSMASSTLPSQVVVAKRGQKVELQLDPAGSAHLRVVDEEGGEPIEGAAIRLCLADEARLSPLGGGPQPLPGAQWMCCDDQGRAEFVVPRGPFGIDVRRSGFEAKVFGPFEWPGDSSVVV